MSNYLDVRGHHAMRSPATSASKLILHEICKTVTGVCTSEIGLRNLPRGLHIKWWILSKRHVICHSSRKLLVGSWIIHDKMNKRRHTNDWMEEWYCSGERHLQDFQTCVSEERNRSWRSVK